MITYFYLAKKKNDHYLISSYQIQNGKRKEMPYKLTASVSTKVKLNNAPLFHHKDK